ncbi:hypothetical protein ACQ4PT_039819 [Festuca glaucescens]
MYSGEAGRECGVSCRADTFYGAKVCRGWQSTQAAVEKGGSFPSHSTPPPPPPPQPPPPPPTTSPHPPPRRAEVGQEMDNPQLPDDMLVKIFLGLPDPADLGRSSVACKSFRNLITGQYFRRKYRKHQNPPLLGLVDEFGMFHRAIPPHPSAPAARVVSEAADFDFNFVNAKSMLKVLDIRDGRVLLSERVSGDGDLEDYLVCDPLHRKFVRLPRMSEPKRRNVFLAPPEVSAGDDDNDGEKAFQVIRMAPKGDQVHTMVFSSSTGQWQAGPSAILEEATASRLFTVVGVTSNCHAQFAHGSFYFLTGKGRETVRLELSSMEISIFNGPPAAAVRGSYFGIMEEKNGAFGLIQVITERLSGEFNYWISEGPIAGPWKLKKTVEVDELQYTFFSCGGKQAFVDHSTHWHSLDIRTLEFQEICNSFDTTRIAIFQNHTQYPW